MKYGLVLVILLLTTSCLQTPEMKNDDGPQASSQQVQDALITSWGDVDPGTIGKNEFMFLEREQKIQDYQPRLIYQEGMSVTERTIETDEAGNESIAYKIIHQTNEISDGESKLSTREEIINGISCTPQTCPQRASLYTLNNDVKPMGLVVGVQTIYALTQACIKDESFQKYCTDIKADKCDLRCHNLKVTESKRAAPTLVQQQANCAGLPNCQLTVKNISFDLILEIKRGESTERQKINYSVAISPDVPYLSRLMDYCYRGLVNIPNSSQKVLVNICNNVKNFKWGQIDPQ